ncbi:hypothetical protein [Saccharothrix deserti]|uniref:hypothetical protein n=1 Tax=Saccharothrix deserti TaxID=2593674 RepID=UPI00131BA03D|nr:hypothetical protein [Saccharothrix deserti]
MSAPIGSSAERPHQVFSRQLFLGATLDTDAETGPAVDDPRTGRQPAGWAGSRSSQDSTSTAKVLDRS